MIGSKGMVRSKEGVEVLTLINQETLIVESINDGMMCTIQGSK